MVIWLSSLSLPDEKGKSPPSELELWPGPEVTLPLPTDHSCLSCCWRGGALRRPPRLMLPWRLRGELLLVDPMIPIAIETADDVPRSVKSSPGPNALLVPPTLRLRVLSHRVSWCLVFRRVLSCPLFCSVLSRRCSLPDEGVWQCQSLPFLCGRE
jgi:hypothetical protein